MNQRAVVEHLLGHGPASRAQIAKNVGLSSPTVGKVVNDLLAVGVLEAIEQELLATDQEVHPGRPGVLLRVNEITPRMVLLQLGVRHTRLSVVPLAGAALDIWAVQFNTPKSPVTMTKRLKAAAQKLKLAAPWAVMVSTPGVVDESMGRVLLSPNLQWTSMVDLPALLGEVWSCPVHLVQEIRALALGQQKAASLLTDEDHKEDFLLVDVGEGVGASVVTGGKLFSPSLPLSGELGHTPVRGNERSCGCGATGCLETLLSRQGLLQSMSEGMGRKTSDHSWLHVVNRIEKNGIEPWFASTLDAGAMVMAGAMNMLGVKRVIVTGALAELPEQVMTLLGEQIQAHAMWGRFGKVTCLAAPRRRADGLMEAAMTRVVLGSNPPWIESKQ